MSTGPRPAPATRSTLAGFRFPSDVMVLAVDEPAIRRVAMAFDELALAI